MMDRSLCEQDLILTNINSESIGVQLGTMSKLEQLARSKALSAQRTKSPDTQSFEELADKKISLLAKLQRNSPSSGGNAKLSLSERLKGLSKKNGLGQSLPEPVSSNIDVKENKKDTSLSSKLQALRKRQPSTGLTSGQPKAKTEPRTQTSEKEQDRAQEQVDSWKKIYQEKMASFDHIAAVPPVNNLLGLTKTVTEPPNEDDVSKRVLKRKYEEIFTVFYPSKKQNTNHFETAQQHAVSNFKKPSPDDIILEAQANVFNQVKDSVSELKISGKQESAPKDKEWLEDNDQQAVEEENDAPKQYEKITTPTKPRNPIDVERYLKDSKPHCSFVVLGHVDAGKSTLMGRLLYDVGAVDINHIRKLKRESERIGKGSFHLAWVMDQTAEERERGVTVSICTSEFETDAAKFTIVDAPGHRDFVPSAIAGISQADVALLSIDCGTDAFESGFNLDGQTKEHTLLARSMGVSRIVVAMNKMDTADWDMGRFTQIKNELGSFFEDIGLKQSQISWVPCSGLSGEGVYKKPYPENQTWYKGPNLIQQLETVAEDIAEEYKDEVVDSKFLFSILEVIPSSKNEEAVITGKVESGSIQPGESITLYPSGQGVLVDKILSGNDQLPSQIAIKGDFITLKLRHAHPEDIEGGDLGASVDYNVEALHRFTVQLLTFNMERPLLPGTPFILFRGVCQQPARISKLECLVDKSDPSKVLKKKVKHLGSNKAAIVEVELTERKRWIPTLTFSQNKHLGRVLLRKDGRTIAAGAVMH